MSIPITLPADAIVVRRRGTWSIIDCRADTRDSVYKLLAKHFSYEVEGKHFIPAVQSHRWDGKIRLVKKIPRGGLSVPAGMTDDAIKLIENNISKVHVLEEIGIRNETKSLVWTGFRPRQYQESAANEAISRCRGIIRLPIRSGKTLIASRITWKLGLKTAFIVTSDALVDQAIEAFRGNIGPALNKTWKVTEYSGSMKDTSGDVVVTSVQALSYLRKEKPKSFKNFANAFNVVFFDEFHHMGSIGDSWREVALDMNAFYKFGLSATVEGVELGSHDKGISIWLRGVCGPVIYELPMSDLIKAGYLMRPKVKLLRHHSDEVVAPAKGKKLAYPAVYKLGIVDNDKRNERIVEQATHYVRRGYRVMIDCGRVGHSRWLHRELKKYLPVKEVALLLGDSTRGARNSIVRDFRARKVKVVVGTVLGEGVDIPELEVVINANGLKGFVPTIQRLRNLTLCEGKNEAIVIDFIDDHHPRLREQTLSRIRIYRAIGTVDFAVEPAP